MTSRPERLRSLGLYIQRSTGLLLFHRVPYRLPSRHEPTPTFQSSSGSYTLRCSKSTRRFAPPSRGAVFQVVVTSLPSCPVATEHLLLTGTVTFRLVAALGCEPRTSTTIPFITTTHQGSPQGARCVKHLSWLDLLYIVLAWFPSKLHTSSNQLRSCFLSRGDRPYPRLCLPTCSRFPTSILRQKLLGSDGAATSHFACNSLTVEPDITITA